MPEQILTTTSALSLEHRLVTLFRERKLTLSLAESCTGGLISARITNIPGASEIFTGCVVCYANDVKHDLLGVPQQILDTEGAVSASCAQAMAAGAREALKSDIAVSVTGIAGPSGGTPTKPVGLVFIGIATGNIVSAEERFCSGDRECIRKQAADAALTAALRAAQ